ncbi:MAG: amidohydrolase family protein [Oscillospiraceae bacterium]|nr:amidohydrolase family protein [Oscillospiraceae bacterium]
MKADCHIHMVLDGVQWRESIARGINDDWIRRQLAAYQTLGYTWLRDGGDRWGVGARARQLAPEYGITYRTPLSPLCRKGHYGGFIGTGYEDLTQYARLVVQAREHGADFIKIMISGLMDFDRFGVLTQPGLPEDEIQQLVHIAHEEGMSVMAHCNGARTAQTAASAGVDSIEHGAYLDEDALQAMVQAHVVWVPTLSTIGNLLGKGRFQEDAVRKILDCAMENVAGFYEMGGLVAPGSDAGAWAVPHGCDTEETWLKRAGVDKHRQDTAIRQLMQRF